MEKDEELEGKMAAGGVHNPSNRLPAGEHFISVSICFRKHVEFLDFVSQE